VTTFKVAGTDITTFNDPDPFTGVCKAALQADGKIVTVGSFSFMVRYNGNGSIDTTFGTRGLVTVPSGFAISTVLIQPSNGDIVVGGHTNNGFALVRYTPNGTLDSTFGSGGEVITSVAGVTIYSGFGALGLENGDIVAGGDGGVLARSTLSGNLDTSFGAGGIVTTPSFARITSLVVQPNGQIVTVGDATNKSWALARYNVNGNLDSTFGSGGIVTSSPSGQGDLADAAALQANGQIVVVGWGGENPALSNGVFFEVGVYNANGSVDTSFGSNGFVTQPGSSSTFRDFGGGVVIQHDGKIVTASSTALTGTFQQVYMLARYGPSAAQIGSFTASPNPVAAGSNVTLTASNITLADPGSTITQVAFYVQVNGTNTLLGYGAQTNPGVWTFTFTVNLTPGSYTLIAQATDSDGILGDLAALTLSVN
jgi:uncharacterized delta-60 repeat protein